MAVATVLGPIGSLADNAHHYATSGLDVFPVKPRDKTPLVSQHQATIDTDQIAAWWERWPHALIGHRIAQQHVLLDVDPRHGGLDTWAALRTETGPLPTTRGHASGRGDGGGHTWWLRPADRLSVKPLNDWAKTRGLGHDNGGKWTAGIDILHRDHRYTILPPSPHPDTGQPYTWIDGHGLHIPPAPLPQLVVDLIVDDRPPAPKPAPGPVDSNSIADWYSATYTWGDLLGRHRWTLVGGNGEDDGSRWRHPNATNAFSATIRHGCLFVYSTNTPFDITEHSDPHGYTLFRAHAVLDHAGDLSAAARAARDTRDGPTTLRDDFASVGTPASNGNGQHAPEHLERSLTDEFWEARPYLAHIRQAAHARQRSAEAVLHVVLARVSAITPHTVTIPPIVGAPAPLSYFTVVVAAPGVGKSSANQIAAYLLPAPDWVPDQLPLGSGEGLAETLFDLVEETSDDGKTRKVKRQVLHNGFIYADEGQTLAEIGTRNGATLLPTIRTIWTGGVLGQANASIERRRIVPSGNYVFGMCIALQPTRAGALLDDVDAGTPQRFGWASAIDPTIPDQPPDWPGPLDWKPPSVITGGQYLDIHPDIAAEIRGNDLARSRGEIASDPLDAHAGLYRLKVAGLLAILDGRHDINLDDWELADTIKAASDRARTNVAAAVAYEAERAEQITSGRLARRHTEAQAAEERRKIVDGARKLARKVWAEPDRWTVSEARRYPLRQWGDVIEGVIEHAVAEGWIVEEEEPGRGTPKRRLKPGEKQP